VMYSSFGKILIVLGILLILVGVIFLFMNKIGILGRLPGDIHVQKKNYEFHFPIVTCVIASILLSLLLTALFKWFRK
jgi:uncharacterized membrane protein